MKRPICAFLVLGLLCACSGRRQGGEEGLSLYYLSDRPYGPAIVSEPYAGGGEGGVEELVSALLSGPKEEGMRSPFPGGLLLRGFQLEEGNLKLDFSEQYGGLADVSLTLADYCVVLTMCQLEEVDSVEITSAGRPIAYRSHQVLTGDEAVLWAENHE